MSDDRGDTMTDVVPEPPAPPSRLRFRLPHFVVTLVVLAVVGVGAWLIVRRLHPGGQYRVECLKVLGEISDGKVAELYQDASPRFQETLLIEKLTDLVDRIDGTLGKFVAIRDVLQVDTAGSVAGRTARVQLELAYAGTDGQTEPIVTTGDLSFLKSKTDPTGKWRLLGFTIHIPHELEAKASALAHEKKRLEAPAQVRAQVTAILELLRAGRVDEVLAQTAPSFQHVVTTEKFSELLQAHKQELGSFVRVISVMSSAINADKDRANVQALLQFEKARTTGTFEFMQLDQKWLLMGYNVVVPEPQPTGPAGPDEDDEE